MWTIPRKTSSNAVVIRYVRWVSKEFSIEELEVAKEELLKILNTRKIIDSLSDEDMAILEKFPVRAYDEQEFSKIRQYMSLNQEGYRYWDVVALIGDIKLEVGRDGKIFYIEELDNHKQNWVGNSEKSIIESEENLKQFYDEAVKYHIALHKKDSEN